MKGGWSGKALGATIPLVVPPLRLQTWISSLLLLPVCFYVAATWGKPHLLSDLNLLVHEAGHLCFAAFGPFWNAAGGTIMQLLVPLVIAAHFWQYRSVLGMQVGLLWLGQNCIDVSVYVADARSQSLELLANTQHDWNYLLARTGLLDYDLVIAYLFCVAAMLCLIGLLLLPFYARDEA